MSVASVLLGPHALGVVAIGSCDVDIARCYLHARTRVQYSTLRLTLRMPDPILRTDAVYSSPGLPSSVPALKTKITRLAQRPTISPPRVRYK